MPRIPLGDITKWIRLPPKYVAPIAILASALVLLPSTALSKFGVSSFMDRYRMWIGLVALTGTALLLSHAAVWAGRLIVGRTQRDRLLKAGKAYLRGLTLEEKLILSHYLARGTKSAKLVAQDGVVLGLESAMIITRVSSVGDIEMHFAYNIQPWAWRELTEHTDLLEPALTLERKHLAEVAAQLRRDGDYP
ncbi:MAG TPA: superinfection exclusion B family protein [bacterium]|nr:superinfection exclusion B family protein [bacterium]